MAKRLKRYSHRLDSLEILNDMRNNHILLLLSAALLALAGCLKEPGPADGGGLRMQVEPSVPEATKGSLTAETLPEFYLRVLSDDPAYSYFVHLSKDGSGAWVSPTRLYWKSASSSVTYAAARFGAHAFAAADFASGVSVALTLPADQSTQERLDAADLLTAPSATKAYSETVDGTLPVAFSHALAKIRFTVTLGPVFYDYGYSSEENPVKDFMLKGMNGGFSFTPSTGEVSVGDAPVDIVPMAGTFTPGTASVKSATVTYEAILVPLAYEPGDLRVTFRVADYEYEWTNAAAVTLIAGKTYGQPVSVTNAPLPQKNGHEYVSLGEGHNWATVNLGAARLSDPGDYFAWAEKEPKTEFNWGTYAYTEYGWRSVSKYTVPDDRVEGMWYHEISPTVSEFIGDGLNHFCSEDDPATYNWGSPWRVPSTDDWNWLLDSAHCSLKWTDNYHGVTGLLVTSKEPGYEGNQVFLPAAGKMDDDTVAGKGVNGAYWSSWLYFTDGKYFTINASDFDFAKNKAPKVGYTSRYMGLTVRAVFD